MIEPSIFYLFVALGQLSVVAILSGYIGAATDVSIK